MVKKSIVVFAILALSAFGVGASRAYTVNQWPAPGIPNTVYGPAPMMPGYYQTNPYQPPMYNYGTPPNVNPYPGAYGNFSPRPY
jgi:hypothetical protein